MKNGLAAALFLAMCLTAIALAGDSLASASLPATVAAQVLRLTGTMGEAQFEIILDQRGGYYRHEWQGKPDDQNSDGFDNVYLQLPYWSGSKGWHWGEFGGRGGEGYSYVQSDPTGAPGKRLAHDGTFGVYVNALDFSTNRHAETFSNLKTQAGFLLPMMIEFTDKTRDTRQISVYAIKSAEVLPDPGSRMIVDLKTKIFGDTRYKDSFYPKGGKKEEWVFEGDLPVRSTTFYENGNKEYEHLYVNGSMASDSRWYANGRFQSTSVFAGNSYAWVQYAQDGHKDSEGQWTYTEPAEGIYSLTTGWELRYHANGQKKELYHVANSKMEGLCQSWDDKGQIVEDGTYHDDKPWEGTFVNIRSEGGIRGSSTSIEGKPMVRHYREGKEVAE